MRREYRAGRQEHRLPPCCLGSALPTRLADSFSRCGSRPQYSARSSCRLTHLRPWCARRSGATTLTAKPPCSGVQVLAKSPSKVEETTKRKHTRDVFNRRLTRGFSSFSFLSSAPFPCPVGGAHPGPPWRTLDSAGPPRQDRRLFTAPQNIRLKLKKKGGLEPCLVERIIL